MIRMPIMSRKEREEKLINLINKFVCHPQRSGKREQDVKVARK